MKTSVEYAKKLNRKHEHLLKVIDKIVFNLSSSEFKQTKYINSRGREYRCYEITDNGINELNKYINHSIRAKTEYLYILKADKYFKIGVSANVEKRIKTISNACPFYLEKVLVCKCSQSVETFLHKKYAKYRMNGEWFNFTEFEVYQEIIPYLTYELKKDIKLFNLYEHTLFELLHLTSDEISIEELEKSLLDEFDFSYYELIEIKKILTKEIEKGMQEGLHYKEIYIHAKNKVIEFGKSINSLKLNK